MKQREPRQKVVLPATMRSDAGQGDICIRDVSSRGMMVQSPIPLARGTYVEIIRPACTIIGRVVWSKGRKSGIQTRERIALNAVLERRKVPREPVGEPPLVQEKRSRRGPSLEEKAARNRRVAVTLQRGALLAGAVVGAVTLASLLHHNLSAALGSVTTALR